MYIEDNDGLIQQSHQGSLSSINSEALKNRCPRSLKLNKPVGLLLDQIQIRRQRSREGNIRFRFFKGDFRINRSIKKKIKQEARSQPLCSQYCRDCNDNRLQKDGLNPFCATCKMAMKNHMKILMFARNVAKKLVKQDPSKCLQGYQKIQESLFRHLINLIPCEDVQSINRIKQSFDFAVQRLILLLKTDFERTQAQLSQLFISINQPSALYLFFRVNAEQNDWDKIKSFSFVFRRRSQFLQIYKDIQVLQSAGPDQINWVVGQVLKRSIQSRWPVFLLHQ